MMGLGKPVTGPEKNMAIVGIDFVSISGVYTSDHPGPESSHQKPEILKKMSRIQVQKPFKKSDVS